MTYERALVTQAGPYMLAAKAKALVAAEVGKGCDGRVLPHPVALEPDFHPITVPKDIMALKDRPCWVHESPPCRHELVRYRVWISPDQPFSWNGFELFLKQLSMVSHRVTLEIIGNSERIVITLLCHTQDMPIVETSFLSKVKFCRLSVIEDELIFDTHPHTWQRIGFYDYYPSPPYSHLLTHPNELHTSPYEGLMTAMANIPAPVMGFYQVLFQPVSPGNNWHRNIEILMDYEYLIKLLNNIGHAQRYAQQAPSGDLRQMAGEVESKAHNDKPFFSAAFRVAVVGAAEVITGGSLTAVTATVKSSVAVAAPSSPPSATLTVTVPEVDTPSKGVHSIRPVLEMVIPAGASVRLKLRSEPLFASSGSTTATW